MSADVTAATAANGKGVSLQGIKNENDVDLVRLSLPFQEKEELHHLCSVYNHPYVSCWVFCALLALIWQFDFSPFVVLIIAILNDGTIMTISKDRVKPSPLPDSWKLKEIFATGVILDTYLALMTVLFFRIAHSSDFFSFVTAIYIVFCSADIDSTLSIFARIHGVRWGWAGVIWLYSIIFYIPLDFIKFIIDYTLSGKAWDNNLLQNKAEGASHPQESCGETQGT